jgi:ABC-type multidrug transport system ATPase subunit
VTRSLVTPGRGAGQAGPARSRVLSVEGLARRFGARDVVAGLDLVMDGGERVALHGPNGSGKTTVIRCVAGTLLPTHGTVDVCGHPAGSLAARALVGVSLSQERSFYARLSGRANLLFFARLRGLGRAAVAAVDDLTEELELHHIVRERVDRCSSGMLQQLAFARALLGQPRLLLLDEPTRSLDDVAIERLWGALDRRNGVAVLLATHVEADLERCDGRVELGA